MRHHASVPDVVAHGAAIGACESSRSTSRYDFSYDRCCALPLRRMRATGGSTPAYLCGVAGSPGGIRRRRAGSPMSAGASGGRCGARAPCRLCLRTLLPSARVRRAGRASGLCSPAERCSTMPSRRRCRQRQQVLHLSRALQRRIVGLVVTVCSPAFSVCERGSQHRRASLLSRAMRGHAIVPDVITHGAAISGCDQGPAASAGLIFLTSDAEPCHRAGCHRSLCRPSARGKGAQQPPQA